MSLTQQLLVRALIAWFWKQPYTRPPIAWGTQLHDQFMLPHFVQRDFREVLDDLKRAGYAFQAGLVRAALRVPLSGLGRVNYLGIDLELRQATEPWYVLGEEPAAGGTARYVDSSVERLQVKARGLYGDRYVVTCNGRRVPLHSTGVRGRVGGGRALSRLAAAFVPASDDPGAYAAGLRRRRHVDRPFDGRMHLSRGASRRAEL